MSLRLAGALTAVLVAGLTGCGSSKDTLIDRSRRIGPISVGETKAKIEAAFGTGRRAFLPGRPRDTPITFYPAASIGVLYYKNYGAVYVETTSPDYRTKSGVGVGSTAAQLKKVGAECQPDQCGIVNGNLGTTFFMSPSFSHRVARAIPVVVGPLAG